MDWKKAKKLLLKLAVVYWVMVLVVYLVAYPQFRHTTVVSDAPSASTTVGEIVDGTEIRQMVTVPADELREISLMTATYARPNQGMLVLTLSDLQGSQLAQQPADISAFEDNKYTTIILSEPVIGRKGESLILSVSSQGCSAGNAVTLFTGNTINAGRFDVVQDIPETERFQVNGQSGAGRLCVKLVGVDELSFYKTYWLIVAGIFAAVTALCVHWWKQAKQGHNNPLVVVCFMCTRYNFLIKQLVSRDFKTKYKRSALGMAWSFLNPLLTMCVQYVVFSTLFKSSIPNFPVYLLTGTIFFSFFTDSVSSGMVSITGNASLIKKVYMPKYIYPLSKILSSLVNFFLSILPLFLVMVITGTPITSSLLLLGYCFLCLTGFVTGMVLLMTTAMTFFQDVQFLWGVISMMWMYLTPIFYPESIIPAAFISFYRLNPMYQLITFARTCIIDGISPAPEAYLGCLMSAMIFLLLGVTVFKRHQDKFVLYL